MLGINGSTAQSDRTSKMKQLEDLKFVILAAVKCQYFANCQACQNVCTVQNNR